MKTNYLQLKQEVRHSWYRCRKYRVNCHTKPKKVMSNPKFQMHLESYETFITAFIRSIRKVLSCIHDKYLFFLTDPDGILLSWSTTTCFEDELLHEYTTITPGISFSERDIGTNAIALARRLNKPVLLAPDHHYCYFFRNWYCYAIPLFTSEQVIGYLDVSNTNKTLNEEMIVVVNLLGEKIITEYEYLRNKIPMDSSVISKYSKSHEKMLTSRQIEVLRLIIDGRTEMAIALELGISLPTVKYHKKKLYERLEVTCIGEAIAKSIKMGLI